jgi:pyruvate dehydrogenase E2 component (dihydrolipoamide acetyltransferase)
MSTSVTLPALGESVTEGTVSRWLKQVGDTVAEDEPLLEVSTDKVDTEIPSPAAGVLLEIKAAEDETVEVGAVLAVIGDADEAPSGDGGQQGSDQGSEAPAGSDSSAADAEIEAEDPTPTSGGTPDSGAGANASRPDDVVADAARETGASDSSGASSGSGGSGGAAQGTEVRLPALGESVTEGTVSRWLKQVGDSVAADEPLLEVSTDKVDTEIPSPAAGTLLEIRVNEDESVEVGAVLAVVGDASAAPASAPEPQEPEPQQSAPAQQPAQDSGQDAPPVQPGQQAAPTATSAPEPPSFSEADKGRLAEDGSRGAAQSAQDAQPEQHGPSTASAPSPVAGDHEGYVTPLVRKLAREHDVDLSTVTGTGVGGRVRKQDVLAAAEEKRKAAEEAAKQPAPAAAPPAAPAAAAPAARSAAPAAEPSALRGTTEKMTRLRSTIARRMLESQQVSASLTATVEVDLTAISAIRARAKDDFKRREGASLSYLPFITKATVEALKVFPKVNATIDTEAGTITYPDAEHIGIAVDTEKGLLVPVVKDAGDLNIAGLAKKIADLAARTRQSKVGPDELTGGTFTITNYGSAGTLMDTPIINQPQVAILGTGALVKRPVVLSVPGVGDTIAVRDMMYLSMTYDHRIVDGADAARFLSMVKARLEAGDFGSEFGL